MFHLPISPPHVFPKPSLQSLPKLPFSIPHQPFFNSLLVHTTIPTVSIKIFSPLQPFSRFKLRHGTMSKSIVWNDTGLVYPCFPETRIGDNSAHNHWSLIAQTKKTGVLQVVNSDDDARNQNSKPITPPSPIPSTYCCYFYTLTYTITRPHMPLKTICVAKN